VEVWYEEYKSEEFNSVLKAYFDTRFAWRFDDPDHAFVVVMDRITRCVLPNAKLKHRKNTTAYVYSCFNNGVRDFGDSLYSKVIVPQPLASSGKRFRRLFWDFCLNRRSVRELMGYCELSENEVRIWTRWLTRERKCPNPGVHSTIKVTGEATDPDSIEVTDVQESPFIDPDEDYRTAQQRYFLYLWSEEQPSDDTVSVSELERKLRTLPRPSLSVTEKLVLRCQLRDLSVEETAEQLGMFGKEQQIRNARNNLKKRILTFCQDNDVTF
jgi:hypothetical protein